MTEPSRGIRERNTTEVPQRRPTVSEVMRRERGDRCRPAGSRDRGSQPVCAEAIEHLRVEVTIIARHRGRNGSEDIPVDRNPPCASRFRCAGSNAPSPAWLIDVAPPERLKLPHSHPCRIEHEKRQPICSRKQSIDSSHSRRRRRIDLFAFVPRQTDSAAVTCGIGLNPVEVQHHRERGQRLTDRLAGESVLVQRRHEASDVGRLDRVDRSRAEHANDTTEIHTMSRGGAVCHVDS